MSHAFEGMRHLLTSLHFIQNEQRQMRKDEASAGNQWQLKLFQYVESDPIYKQLAAHVKGIPSEEDAYIFRGNA